MSVHITSVHPKTTHRGQLWRIRDDQGGRYSTENMWLASVCQRALEQQREVVLTSSAGWYDRTLQYVAFVDEQAVPA